MLLVKGEEGAEYSVNCLLLDGKESEEGFASFFFCADVHK